MKHTYTPTEADRLTGENVRRLRRLAGETLVETIERSGVGIKQSSLSRVELGQRQLSMPEATKLAAHWNTTAEKLFVKAPVDHDSWPKVVQTEQVFLGNEKPALFAVPAPKPADPWHEEAPMNPEQYRIEVWLPYLEARYAADQQKTA